MNGSLLSVWLVPNDPRLRRIVDALAQAHAAPRFAPHLTLLGAVESADADAAGAALAAIAASSAPLALPLLGCSESEVYFETAFLRCAETPQLTALRERVHVALGSGRAPRIGPHVSLIYARLPPATRQQIARANTLAGALRLDALALVASGPHGWEPVEQWRVIAEHALGG